MSKVSPGNYRRGWIAAIVFIVLLGLLTTGCVSRTATLVKKSEEQRQHPDLLARFNQYWTARARKDAQAAFKLEAPYIQEMVNQKLYGYYLKTMSGKAEISAVEILGVQCEQSFYCVVNCRMVYVAAGKEDVRNLRDCWVKADGTWGHVVVNPLIFPQLQ